MVSFSREIPNWSGSKNETKKKAHGLENCKLGSKIVCCMVLLVFLLFIVFIFHLSVNLKLSKNGSHFVN